MIRSRMKILYLKNNLIGVTMKNKEIFAQIFFVRLKRKTRHNQN